MLRTAAVILFLLATVIVDVSAQIGTHHVILIDNTGSMRGRPLTSGRPNIWAEVKSQISTYLSGVKKGDKITLHSFDVELKKSKKVDFISENGRQEAIQFVNGLDATGLNTCVYSCVSDALDQLSNQDGYRVLFYVFTDFETMDCNLPGGEKATMAEIREKFGDLKGSEYDHMYYVLLGREVPPEIKREADADPSISAASKAPEFENIFPEVTVDLDTINLDFTRSRLRKVVVPMSSVGQGKYSDVDVTLEIDGCPVQLIDSLTQVLDSGLELSFGLDSSFYGNKDVEASLIFDSKLPIKLNNSELGVKVTVPRKRVLQIDYD